MEETKIVRDLFDRMFEIRGHWWTIDILDRHADDKGAVPAPCEDGNIPLATIHWWRVGEFVAVTSDLNARPLWHKGKVREVLAHYRKVCEVLAHYL